MFQKAETRLDIFTWFVKHHRNYDWQLYKYYSRLPVTFNLATDVINSLFLIELCLELAVLLGVVFAFPILTQRFSRTRSNLFPF